MSALFPQTGRGLWQLALCFIFGNNLGAQNPTAVIAQAEQKIAAHDLDGAWDLLNKATESNPGVSGLPEMLAYTDYVRGKIPNAEMEFKKAIRLNDHSARAWLGLGRVFEAASFRAKAKACYQKAWREDPADPEIQRYYARTLSAPERLAGLEKLQASGSEGGPVMDTATADSVRGQIEQLKWMGNRSPFAIARQEHAEIKLSLVLQDSKTLRGFALPVSINGGKTLHLLMDTGASGIVINSQAAGSAALEAISAQKIYGLGDEGARIGRLAFAGSVRVGDTELADCPIVITDRKFLTDEDGLIGTDIFSGFLVTIDFDKMLLKLDPLPAHKSPAGEKWQDREVAPEFAAYTSFWRLGHDILLPMRVNDGPEVLFLLDTGSSTSLIDPDYARKFTEVRNEDYVTVKGISGKVNKVQSAGFVSLTFGRYRQRVQRITAVPLTGQSLDSPRFTGILGVNMLRNFRMKIDYRDGLLALEYAGPNY